MRAGPARLGTTYSEEGARRRLDRGAGRADGADGVPSRSNAHGLPQTDQPSAPEQAGEKKSGAGMERAVGGWSGSGEGGADQPGEAGREEGLGGREEGLGGTGFCFFL